MINKDRILTHQAEGAQPVEIDPRPLTEYIISAKHLVKKFSDEVAVNDVSFDIPSGTIFGFIGPSGSGKTTTIRLLTGLYAPTSGQATMFGKNPLKFKRIDRSRFGYMPQHFVLYPNLTVLENLNFAASLYGMGFFRSKRLRNTLNFVELYDHRHSLARNISGGMQRRLSLAATLIHNPMLLFLDEPTAGIDPVLRHKFWDHFREMKEQGATIFITTQYVSEAEYCDLVGVQDNGHLILVDTPKGVRHKAYGGDIVDLKTEDRLTYEDEASLRSLPFVLPRTIRTGDNSMRIVVDAADTATPQLIEWAQRQKLKVKTMEEYLPSFEDVFVELVRPQEVANA